MTRLLARDHTNARSRVRVRWPEAFRCGDHYCNVRVFCNVRASRGEEVSGRRYK